MRFLLVALVMLLSNVTSFAVEEFASDEVNVENVTEMVSSDTQIDGADSDDGFDFGLIIVCALFVAFLYVLLSLMECLQIESASWFLVVSALKKRRLERRCCHCRFSVLPYHWRLYLI